MPASDPLFKMLVTKEPEPAYQVELATLEIEARLQRLMASDLSFKGLPTGYAGHNTHAFAAKFPPQLPRAFIEHLTDPGDTVLDPMAGSGTAVLEAALSGRRGIGIDLDPLAVKIAHAKTSPIETEDATIVSEQIADHARLLLTDRQFPKAVEALSPKTREFIDYWFMPETALQLYALARSIKRLGPPGLRSFFDMVFSSIIVTKSGGVSLARDLAHSRPHKVSDKRIGDAIEAFSGKARRAIASMNELQSAQGAAQALQGDSRYLPLPSESVDLVVTSPPYANAIDYVRAHKFSLVWFGYDIEALDRFRRSYIGAEVHFYDIHKVPSGSAIQAVQDIAKIDRPRATIVARYFYDMSACIGEMYRVLRPGRAAIVVVGSSTARGITVPTPFALAELGEATGFKVVGVEERQIDRDRRLMPISRRSTQAGIEARMHSEHVLGMVKS